MAVNMNPTSSVITRQKAGSLLMRPTQVASVKDVEEPENTLASVAAVAPSVSQPTPEPVEQPQEPAMEPVAPAVPEEPPVEQPTEVPQGIQFADEQSSRAVLDSFKTEEEYGGGAVDASTIEIDYDHPAVKEEIQRKALSKKVDVVTNYQRAVDGSVPVDELRKVAEKYSVSPIETAEGTYEALENRAKRSFYGYIEAPRYIAAIPGLTARVLDNTAKDTDSKLLKGVTSAAVAAGDFLMDVIISRFTSTPMVTSGLYKKGIVDPVVNGRTVDQQFENDLLKSIKDKTGVTLTEDYLQERAFLEAGQEGAATFGIGGIANALRQGTKAVSATMAKTIVGEASKGAASSVVSVWGANTAISLIDPKSKEGQVLAGIMGGAVGGSATAALTTATGKVAKYTPTGLLLRGSKVVLDKVVGSVQDANRDRKIGKIMRIEGTDRKEAIRRYYTRLDAESPERKNLALRLLNDTELKGEERIEATQQLIDLAMKDPLGREAEVVRTAIAVINRDSKAIEGAWSQAELLNRAFNDKQFKADVFDVYEGKYTDDFLKLREEVSPEEILSKQKAMLDYLRHQMEKNTSLTDIERSELSLAAKMLEKDIDESIQNELTYMQQNVAGALDMSTDTRFSADPNTTPQLSQLRESLVGIKEKAKALLRTGYAAIDSQNKVTSTSAFSEINTFLETMDKSNPAYKDVQKAFNSLMAESTTRYRDTTQDTSIVAGTKANPTTRYSPTALKKTDEVVYLNPEQFQELTGVKLKESTGGKPLKAMTSIELELDADGSYIVKGAKDAELSAVLGKDTLIPVSMDSSLLLGLVDRRVRIKNQKGSVTVLDLNRQLGKTGDDRHNIALLDQAVYEGRRKGNLSQEGGQSSFLPKFDISKIALTYREMDQFQRTIRRLRKEAYNRKDDAGYLSLKELDQNLTLMIEDALKDDPQAFSQRKALDALYGDSFVPEFQRNKSLIGGATTKTPDRAYRSDMSEILGKLEGSPELRQQLLEVLDPEQSKFIKGLRSKRSQAQLDLLVGLDQRAMADLKNNGKNVAAGILDIKMSELLENVYKNIGTNMDPMVNLKEQIAGLRHSPDFNALMIAAEGTDTHSLIMKALSLPDDEDLSAVVKGIQDNLDKFDSIIYKSIRGMKDPANTKAVLDFVGDIDKMDQLEADMILNGELGAAAPHMMRIVLSDILKMGDDGFSVASIQNGINKYKGGLERLPGGTEVIRELEKLKDNQGILNKLNRSAGKASLHLTHDSHMTGTERGISYLPSVFSDIKSARKGIIGMDYAVFSSITGIATKEMRALRKTETKAISEVFAAALMNKEVFEKLMSVNTKLNEASPAERLRGISLLVHSANGVRLGALEYMADTVDSSANAQELLERLRASPEFQEVEAEDMLAEEIPKLLQRPESQMEPSTQSMEDAAAKDPLHEVTNADGEGIITDGLTQDEATYAKSVDRFITIKSSGIPKEDVIKILEASGMAENNNKGILMKALDKAYETPEETPGKQEEW